VGLSLSQPVFLPEPNITPRKPIALPHRPNIARRIVETFDRGLRWFYGVREYSTQGDCLLRIAPAQVTEPTRLADGGILSAGTAILDLHLWNEHLLALPEPYSGLSRGAALRCRIATSLSDLARHLESDPALRTIAAIRAQTALAPRRRTPQLLRLAAFFGFGDAAAPRGSRWHRAVIHCGQNIFIWALAWTFNPSALRRNGLGRQHCELWITRDRFLAMHGRDAIARACIDRMPARFVDAGAIHREHRHRAAAESLRTAMSCGFSNRGGR